MSAGKLFGAKVRKKRSSPITSFCGVDKRVWYMKKLPGFFIISQIELK